MKTAILALLWLASSSLISQTFRVAVDGVAVDVLVTHENRPVLNLDASDFELRDRGVLQRVDSVAFEDVPVNVMLVFDTSSSVEGEPLNHLKEAAAAVIALLRPNDRAALLTFTGAIRQQASWTGDRHVLEAAIKATEAGGTTALHDAAYAALTLRDSRPGRTLVLVFSDGADTASWLPGGNVIDVAQRNDAVVYAVTLGSDGNVRPGLRLDFHSGIQARIRQAPRATLLEQFLRALANETGGKVLHAERSDQLQHAFLQILTEFRARYLLTYTPRGVDATGWHPIEVKLNGRRGTVTARRGYLR